MVRVVSSCAMASSSRSSASNSYSGQESASRGVQCQLGRDSLTCFSALERGPQREANHLHVLSKADVSRRVYR